MSATLDTLAITVEILATGADTCIPDTEGAVDVAVYAHGVKVGEATLGQDHNGLSVYGDAIDMWANHDLQHWIESVTKPYDDGDAWTVRDIRTEIERATRDAVS